MASAESSPESVFTARGLTKVYGEGATAVHALRGVDLDILRGEFVMLLGASGSGKSTLLNILGGLDTATSGSAGWTHNGQQRELIGADGAELTRYRREHTGFAFQFYNLIPSLTARENVALMTDLAEDPMASEDALGLVGLGLRVNHFVSQLWGGEQQRMAIARAIAKRPAETALCDHRAHPGRAAAACAQGGRYGARTREVLVQRMSSSAWVGAVIT